MQTASKKPTYLLAVVWWCEEWYFTLGDRTGACQRCIDGSTVLWWNFAKPCFPIMQNNGRLFQHDNPRPRTARVTTAYPENNNVPVLPWPSKLLYLNPIEHLWDELDRVVRERQPAPQSLQQLVVASMEGVGKHSAASVRNLTSSMGRHCQAVIDARSGDMRYWKNGDLDLWICNELWWKKKL
jgi:hypothetical protein